MRRISANKNVLSSRLNSVRQMSCWRSSDSPTAVEQSDDPKTSIAEPWLCSGDPTCVDISWLEQPTSYVRDELAVVG